MEIVNEVVQPSASQEKARRRKEKYVIIRLYDARTKKRTTTSVNRGDFQNEEDLMAYCAKIREDNKKANAHVRKERRLHEIQQKMRPDVLATPLATRPVALPEMAVALPELPPFPAVEYDRDVVLRLDEGTGNTCVIFGSSKQGKSTLAMRIYDKYYSDKNIIASLFSGNPQLKLYRKSKLIIGYGFGPQQSNYIKMQQYIQVRTKNKYKFLNILDDIVDQKYSNVINKMILTYRNSDISSIILLQDATMLSKPNRGNVNNTFVFRGNSAELCEKYVRIILQPYFRKMGLRTLDDQIAFFMHVTENHGFCYVDNIKGTIRFGRLDLR